MDLKHILDKNTPVLLTGWVRGKRNYQGIVLGSWLLSSTETNDMGEGQIPKINFACTECGMVD